jgi:hypothetical protein
VILWTFMFSERVKTFAGRAVRYQSARVAAPTRELAQMLIGAKLEIPITLDATIVCTAAGMIPGDDVGVISLKREDGIVEAG